MAGELRFKIGQLVVANMEEGWVPGKVAADRWRTSVGTPVQHTNKTLCIVADVFLMRSTVSGVFLMLHTVSEAFLLLHTVSELWPALANTEEGTVAADRWRTSVGTPAQQAADE